MIFISGLLFKTIKIKKMNIETEAAIADVLTSTHYLPCISLIMPFEPKMGLKKELTYKIKIAADQIKKEVNENYPPEKATPVLNKLMKVIDGLNYNTHKKSVAIFISPVFEKVIYLDMLVEEKVVIDESFEIRDLILNKKETQQYLLVVLTGKCTKIFVGHNGDLKRVTENFEDNIENYINDISEKIANFSDENKRKEILFDKLLKHTDNGLALLMQAYQGPVFVMGTVKTIGHFKSLSKNLTRIVDYIPGSFDEKTDHELHNIMLPYLKNWKQVQQKSVIKLLDEAMSKKKLVFGMGDVWKAASLKQGRLLVVEKGFSFKAEHTDENNAIRALDNGVHDVFYIKDAVDDVIEKVLMCGGSVEFVEDGLLLDYQKIALVEYYPNA